MTTDPVAKSANMEMTVSANVRIGDHSLSGRRIPIVRLRKLVDLFIKFTKEEAIQPDYSI